MTHSETDARAEPGPLVYTEGQAVGHLVAFTVDARDGTIQLTLRPWHGGLRALVDAAEAHASEVGQ